VSFALKKSFHRRERNRRSKTFRTPAGLRPRQGHSHKIFPADYFDLRTFVGGDGKVAHQLAANNSATTLFPMRNTATVRTAGSAHRLKINQEIKAGISSSPSGGAHHGA
jgi:hypothetical protein